MDRQPPTDFAEPHGTVGASGFGGTVRIQACTAFRAARLMRRPWIELTGSVRRLGSRAGSLRLLPVPSLDSGIFWGCGLLPRAQSAVHRDRDLQRGGRKLRGYAAWAVSLAASVYPEKSGLWGVGLCACIARRGIASSQRVGDSVRNPRASACAGGDERPRLARLSRELAPPCPPPRSPSAGTRRGGSCRCRRRRRQGPPRSRSAPARLSASRLDARARGAAIRERGLKFLVGGGPSLRGV